MKKSLITTTVLSIVLTCLVCSTSPTRIKAIQTSPKCDTVCFHSPGFFLLNPQQMSNRPVLIGRVNFNLPTNNIQAIKLALRGNSRASDTLTPLQILNQQFTAAQLSIEKAGGSGSPAVSNALWTNLGCPSLFGDFPPVTLSNGFIITPSRMLKDVFIQAGLAVQGNQARDMIVIAAFLRMLHRNRPFGSCALLSTKAQMCSHSCFLNFLIRIEGVLPCDEQTDDLCRQTVLDLHQKILACNNECLEQSLEE